MASTATKRTCRAENKRGEPCSARAVTAEGFCAMHGGLVDPQAIGRKGGSRSPLTRLRREADVSGVAFTSPPGPPFGHVTRRRKSFADAAYGAGAPQLSRGARSLAAAGTCHAPAPLSVRRLPLAPDCPVPGRVHLRRSRAEVRGRDSLWSLGSITSARRPAIGFGRAFGSPPGPSRFISNASSLTPRIDPTRGTFAVSSNASLTRGYPV